MAKFSVYQLKGSENRDLRFDVTFGENCAEVAKKAFYDRRYTCVAEITADDLNHCFEVGNIGPEQNIARFGPMASLSSGDLLCDPETGATWFIARVGFEEIIAA